MAELIDNCENCREGRATFLEVMDHLKDLSLTDRRARKTMTEWEAQYNAPSNCGNPRCPNKKPKTKAV